MAKKSKYKYQQADKFFMINTDDRDLIPIKIPIPESPPPQDIDGYGLPPEDQKFTRPKVPARLLQLQDQFEDIGEITDYLYDNQVDFKEELEFIEREWGRRKNGFWFYNNGKPTFLSGTNYLYISYWEIDVGIPEYRDRDRKWFMAVRFGMLDPNCLGITYPKHRREGATHKTQCWMYDIISQIKRAHGGIQSATEPHGEDVFQMHLVPGWQSLPFFFKPVFEGSTNPKKILSFNEPGVVVRKGAVMSKKQRALGSRIDYKSSAVKAYDSRKLTAYHSDECGKTSEIDINKRHEVVKECLVIGKKIIGFAVYTSTVGEAEKEGGANFKKLCEQSHYDHWEKEWKRDKNGRTISGMYNIFLPAFEGLEGYVDEYGISMEDDAKEFLSNTKQGFIDAEDWEGLSGFVRKYPTKWAECWRGDGSKCKFNIKILEERLDILTMGANKEVVQGNFEWERGVVDSTVIWVPNPKGRWNISWLHDNPKHSNRYYNQNGVRYPLNETKFVVGSDPFKFKVTRQGKKSKGGGGIKRLRDTSIDPPDKDINTWETDIMIGSYLHRTPTKDGFGEDMLMAAIYYGCYVATENNVDLVWDHIERRGYHGYLFYETDVKTGKYKKTPGFHTGTATIEEIFKHWQYYIEKHGHRCVHDAMLQQCLEIGDDMGDYDAFTAGGMCHMAGDRLATVYVQEEKEEQKEEWLQVYNYK